MTPEVYNRKYKTHKLDPYRILRLYEITDPAIQHAIKKLLRCGRAHKPMIQDIQEVIDTLHRWQEMEKEDTQ